MKDLNECKAEIFSRSEKAIEKRHKKRKRILYGVLPVLISVLVCVTAAFPNMPFSKSKDADAANGSATPEAGMQNENSGVFLSIEGSGKEISRITDENKTQEVYSCILSLYENGGNYTYESTSESSAETAGVIPGKYGNDGASEYVFTFSLESEEETFVFDGEYLYRKATGESICVSLDELKEIINF